MFKMQYSDGTTITLTGDDAKDVSTAVKQSIHDHAVLLRVDRTTRAIKNDTAFLVKAVPSEIREELDAIHVTGTRLKQVTFVREILKRHPDWRLHHAAQVALAEVRGADGFGSLKEIDNYCRKHRDWLLRP